MTQVINQAQIEADYDYVANLYTYIGKLGILDDMFGFSRSTEEMVGTFYYEVGDHFLYINPCVASYLCGEELDQIVSVTMVDSNGDIAVEHNVELKITRDLDTDAHSYADIVRDVLYMISFYKA